ncbi:very short patch repair endonuclease [Glaciibacter flavus]|uniref:Very short patch repair endonuclease n=1 Tax=Orlajensenia flava TaxID=2565934 RepID=A0A4S4FUG0_9MICO|nr:very short patch repair endonuclease [Glaciibacter flavus]THG34343.1 very short patch repair endonuclease [Glaciibacter flavus]
MTSRRSDEGSSWASSFNARQTMRANKGRDTKPELDVRRLLHAHGYRYRVNHRPDPSLRRTADIVFTRARVAVFIDGCYWHGCPEHFVLPTANRNFWEAKIVANRIRDAETSRQLVERQWTVLRFWEHDTGPSLRAVVSEIEAAVDAAFRRR